MVPDPTETAKQLLRFAACLLCFAVLGFPRPRHVVAKTVNNRFHALALDKQKLTGLLGSRLRANSEGFLENIDMQAMLAGMNQADESLPQAIERRFPGQFLDAAADAFEYNHDLQLRSQMDRIAKELATFARTVVPKYSSRLTESNLLDARSDLIGLLAYYRVTSEPEAYATAQIIGSALIKLLTVEASHEEPTQEATALARVGLIEPVLQLHRLTGDKKYLDFCLALAQAVRMPAITDSTPQGALIGSLQGLIGFADLYEISANKAYLQPVLAAWKTIVQTRLSVTGAPLIPGHQSSDVDACSSTAWLQFNDKLLRLTGEAMYGDQVERTIYNQVLATQDSRNGNISPSIPFNGSKVFPGRIQGESGVCMLAAAKALSLLPQLVWGRFDNGIAINLYTSGRGFFTLPKHGLVQIYSEGLFPATGQMQLHVEPSIKAAQFPLRLRVPIWAGKFTVDIASLHLVGQPGEVVIIGREWKSGDTVRVSMDLPLKTMPSPGMPDDIVLQRGPQILALGRTLNPDIRELDAASLQAGASGHFEISDYQDKVPRNFNGDQVYRISGSMLGKQQDLLLVPFADAFNYRASLHQKLQ